MNKPILFIDEKPFDPNPKRRSEAESQYNDLKERLSQFGGIDVIEFFFEVDIGRKIPNDYSSEEFKSLVKDRKFIVIHNSYPDSYDPNPIMSDAEIKIFRTKLNKDTKLIRFSGSIHLRMDEFNVQEPSIKHFAYNREILYNNFDTFIRHLIQYNFENPYFKLIEDGNNAFSLEAMSIQNEIEKDLYKESVGLAQKINNQKPILEPVSNWKTFIGDFRFQRLCMLAGWKPMKIIRATHRLREKNYNEPADYLTDINIVVDRTKDRII